MLMKFLYRLLPWLSAIILLLAAQPGRAAEGYWVLDKITTTGGSGGSFQFKVGKNSVTVVTSGSANGTSFSWPDFADKIKFGDEAKLGIPVQINCPDPATARLMQRAKMMSLTVTVAMWDPYECRDYTRNNNPFQWRTEVTASGIVSRRPEVDMHEERFTPTAESTLTISVVASLNTPITVDGKSVSGVSGGRIYHYKYVGDKPEYGFEQDATDTPGESGGLEIPPALFWIGGSVVGILAVNRLRKNRKNKKGGNEPPEPQEEKPKRHPSSFRMILYKEFGDTLRVGDQPKVVGARIEETTFDGQRRERPDLTATIRILEGENIQVLDTRMSGKYKSASLRVPEPTGGPVPAKGSIVFCFETATGILRNQLNFFIEDNLQIRFCQDNITFVAGQRNTETIYFYVHGFAQEPAFDAVLEGDPKKTFSLSSRVRPDKENSWSVDLTDCLTEIPANMAGCMDNCYLSITARQNVGTQERKVTERLPVHRFYEGLRMELGHIKAYPVVKGSEGINTTEVQPTSYDEEFVPAHTRMDLTLFVWDRDKNMIGSPPPEGLEVRFEDIPESLEWFGKKGAETTEPVHMLGFQLEQYGIDSRPISQHADVKGSTMTFVYEIIPASIMLPPNRCKAAVTATASYKGRSFEAKQTSMVISMPIRMVDDTAELNKLIKFDNQVREKLLHMITRLTGLQDSEEFKALIYKCELMLDSFDERFGFYMPDYYQADKLFRRTVTGQVGPLFVAENTYVWEEVYFGDGFNMCMETFEEHEPKTIMGRLVLGFVTLGYSEMLYYTPKRFLLECRKAGENYDNTFFDNFFVGAKFAGEEILESLAWQKGLSKVSSTQFGQALQEMGHEFHRDIRAIERSLCRSYSSVRFVSKISRGARKIGALRIDGRLLGRKNMQLGKAALDSSPDLKGLKAIEERAIKMGEKKVKEFIKACNSPDISPEELKRLVLSIQCDRYAKNYFNSVKGIDKYRWRFTTENEILHGHVKQALKKQLAQKFGVHESEITFFEATGNSAKSAFSCKKVGMDHDFTIRVRGKDLPEEVASRFWNDEYCFQATGSKNFSPWDADKLAFKAEQTAVSFDGPESFGSDVSKVVNPKETAAQAFDDAKLVQKVQTHKVRQEIDQFESCMEKASKTADPEWKAVYEEEALSHLREAARQYPKGMDRTLESKLEVVEHFGEFNKLNLDKVRSAYELRGRIEDMLSRSGRGDSGALIEFYASYRVQGKSLAKETEKAFSLITEVDEIIKKGPSYSSNIRILPDDLSGAARETIKGGLEETWKEEDAK